MRLTHTKTKKKEEKEKKTRNLRLLIADTYAIKLVDRTGKQHK